MNEECIGYGRLNVSYSYADEDIIVYVTMDDICLLLNGHLNQVVQITLPLPRRSSLTVISRAIKAKPCIGRTRAFTVTLRHVKQNARGCGASVLATATATLAAPQLPH